MQTLFATYSSFKAVTVSDSTLVNCRAIYVGGAGTVILSPDSTTAGVTLASVTAGTIIPASLDSGRIMASSTATALVALA